MFLIMTSGNTHGLWRQPSDVERIVHFRKALWDPVFFRDGLEKKHVKLHHRSID